MGEKFIKPRIGKYFESFPVAAATIIYQGDHLVNDAGYCRPATAADLDLPYLGVADKTVDNSAGGDGAKTAHIRRKDTHRFENSAVNAVTSAMVGYLCYLEDADTVSSSDILPPCGEVIAADSDYVWVERVPTGCFELKNLLGSKAATVTTIAVAAEVALVFYTNKDYYNIKTDGGAHTLTLDFPDGIFTGQRIILRGYSDTDYVTVPDAINTDLANNGSMALKLKDKLCLFWNGSDWEEEWRQDFTA